MASEETSFRPVAISAAPMDAIAVFERVRELGRSGSADGCVCISGMISTELGLPPPEPAGFVARQLRLRPRIRLVPGVAAAAAAAAAVCVRAAAVGLWRRLRQAELLV